MTSPMSFDYNEQTAPTDEASAGAFVAKLVDSGATDWRIEFVRTHSGEKALFYCKSAVEAVIQADKLLGASPPMPSVLVPLSPVG